MNIEPLLMNPKGSNCFYVNNIYEVPEQNDLEEIHEFMQVECLSALGKRLNDSVRIIRNILKENKTVAISFNGGKDATVVMHLVRLACYLEGLEYQQSTYDYMQEHVKSFVIHTEPQFRELAEFFGEADRKFALQTLVIQGSSFKDCLADFVKRTGATACFLGVRSVDPSAHMGIVAKPSPGWPNIIRVSPILEWQYDDVFDFLVRFSVKYCQLYDRGFTSLGSSEKTIKNPSLNSNKQKISWFRKKVSQSIESVSRKTPVEEPGHHSEDNIKLVADVLLERGVSNDLLLKHMDDDAYSSPAFLLPFEDSYQVERVNRK